MKSMTNWYQFHTRCEELIPNLNGVKFTVQQCSKEAPQRYGSFEHPKQILKIIDKRISQKLVYTEIRYFWNSFPYIL